MCDFVVDALVMSVPTQSLKSSRLEPNSSRRVESIRWFVGAGKKREDLTYNQRYEFDGLRGSHYQLDGLVNSSIVLLKVGGIVGLFVFLSRDALAGVGVGAAGFLQLHHVAN